MSTYKPTTTIYTPTLVVVDPQSQAMMAPASIVWTVYKNGVAQVGNNPTVNNPVAGLYRASFVPGGASGDSFVLEAAITLIANGPTVYWSSPVYLIEGAGPDDLNTKIGDPTGGDTLYNVTKSTNTYAQGTAQQVTTWNGSGITLAASERVYHAVIDFNLDNPNNRDEYTVRFFKDMGRLTAGVTSPTIQLVKRADGTDLLAETPLVAIGASGAYKYDAQGAARISKGETVLCVVRATIDGVTRTMERPISRDA